MANFASLAAAEIRAEAQVLAGVWIEAHCEYNNAGVPAVRMLRKTGDTTATADGQTGGGCWDMTISDSAN